MLTDYPDHASHPRHKPQGKAIMSSEGSWLPRSWQEARPHLVWGILIFACGFEGIASLIHGEWLQAVFGFAGMLALTAILIHGKKIKETFQDIQWQGAAVMVALLIIVLSPFVEQRRWPFSIPRQLAPPMPPIINSIYLNGEYLRSINPVMDIRNIPAFTVNAISIDAYNRLSVAVDYQTLARSKTRIPLITLSNVANAQQLDIVVVTRMTVAGIQEKLWWGNPLSGNAFPPLFPVAGASMQRIAGDVVIIGPDNGEQHIPFDLLRLPQQDNQPDLIDLTSSDIWAIAK